MHAELQVHARLSSGFMIFDCLIGCSFKEEGQFQVNLNCFFFNGSVLLFNEKPMTVYGQISCIYLDTNVHLKRKANFK